jgi:putative transposase
MDRPRPRLGCLKDLERENSRLRKAVSDLTLDKLILQEAARGNF